MIESVKEKDIVRNHVRIIAVMIDEYNEMMQFDFEDELQYPNIPNWRVVQELLLAGTTHSGRISSVEKCIEIGLNPDENAFPERKEDD